MVPYFNILFITEKTQPSRNVRIKGVLNICSKFTGEHPCGSVILIKLLCNFIEIVLRHGCSPVNLLHIFRTPLPKNTSEGAAFEIANANSTCNTLQHTFRHLVPEHYKEHTLIQIKTLNFYSLPFFKDNLKFYIARRTNWNNSYHSIQCFRTLKAKNIARTIKPSYYFY